jgi:hypothetical protein
LGSRGFSDEGYGVYMEIGQKPCYVFCLVIYFELVDWWHVGMWKRRPRCKVVCLVLRSLGL